MPTRRVRSSDTTNSCLSATRCGACRRDCPSVLLLLRLLRVVLGNKGMRVLLLRYRTSRSCNLVRTRKLERRRACRFRRLVLCSSVVCGAPNALVCACISTTRCAQDAIEGVFPFRQHPRRVESNDVVVCRLVGAEIIPVTRRWPRGCRRMITRQSRWERRLCTAYFAVAGAQCMRRAEAIASTPGHACVHVKCYWNSAWNKTRKYIGSVILGGGGQGC